MQDHVILYGTDYRMILFDVTWDTENLLVHSYASLMWFKLILYYY